jgi:UDP:flavonoid glycosyltransferase YjiC (YdhE family)
MRVAFAFWPTSAHLNPLVPLAWALRTAGHEVVMTSHPSAAPDVLRTGLPFTPACRPEEMAPPAGPMAQWPEARAVVRSVTARLGTPAGYEMEWQTVGGGFLPSMWDFTGFSGGKDDPLPVIDGMVAFFDSWRPDLVVWDPCMPGAAVAARTVGARQLRQCGTDQFGWYQDRFDARVAELGLGDTVPNPFVETLRGPAERHGVTIDRELLRGEATIAHVPDALNLPVDVPRIPMAWVPYVGQVPTPDWLYPRPERPRVALSLGTSLRQYLPDFDWTYLQVVLDALAALDVEVVATLDAHQRSAVRIDPHRVRVVEILALDQLVPTCDLLIHHGGLGTSAPAAAAGVPQLVLDHLEDDGDRYKLAATVGDYVAGWGAGGVLNLSHATVERVRDDIARTLQGEAAREGAAALRRSLATRPTPAEVVRVLERVVAGGGV